MPDSEKAVIEKANILIVDDLPEKLLVYRTVLEELGQNVVAVRSGSEALKQVLKEDFAVILLDVNMPDIDGFETAQLIRQRKRSAHTPIIFLTSFADELRIQQGYARGAVDYIPAPVIPEILRAKVRVFVELFHMRQQVAQQAQEQAKRAAAEDSARRSAFLAEASRALSATLDFEATLTALVKSPVPHLADICLVTLQHERGGFGRTVGAWTDPASAAVHGDIALMPTPLSEIIELVMESGRRDTRPQLSPISFASTHESGVTDVPHSSITSLLVLPLWARGRILGAMTFASGVSRRRLRAAEVGLAEELSSRAAIALDNAILLRDIQEADRRKNEFLAMLAHELRNPLAPIRNAVHLLRMRESDEASADWARDIIDRQVTNLVRMVDDLLDVARINEGKIQLLLENVEVNGLVNRALETSRPTIESHNHSMSVLRSPAPLYVRGDSTRLSQVLSNLLNNAAKYTPDGGRIEVIVEADGGDVLFRVRDNGTGIPRELLGKIFDLFTQANQSLDRSQGGLGIGLTLVRRLVEMHGGSVQANSGGPGKGSEFIVRLPQCAAAPRSADEPAVMTSSSSAPLRVLVVDDNIDVAESLAMILRIYNHEVRLAHDGPSALQGAQAFQPHVVFLDIGLPGMNGFEVALRLRGDSALSLSLLIAISGYGQDDDIQRSREAGFDHHLIKPVAPDLIQQLLGRVSAQMPETAGSSSDN